MNWVALLIEWAIRSSVLILGGSVLLWALRVKDPSVRLAACVAMLCGSLSIPTLTAVLPKLPIARGTQRQVAVERNLAQDFAAFTSPDTRTAGRGRTAVPALPRAAKGLNAESLLLAIYASGVLCLWLRLSIGLAMSWRLSRDSRPGGSGFRESDRVTAPVSLGILRPSILLPADWREWDQAKLEAVLAHERSHIRRWDPAVQFISAIHRSLLWFSPLSWILHRRIVRLAEEASDDAAVAVLPDRARYAEILVAFMNRGSDAWGGVPMARYGRAEARIHRILDRTSVSHGVTRLGVAAVVALALPMTYLAAAASAQSTSPAAPHPVVTAPPPSRTVAQAQVPPPQPTPVARPEYLTGLGNVVSLQTVTIRPRIDGQLMSVDVSEGDAVREGQLVATIDDRSYQLDLQRAENQLARDKALFNDASNRAHSGTGPQSEADQLAAGVQADIIDVMHARLMLSYTRLISPISGVAGLRQIDPGNMVHTSDPKGILVITQLDPIAVVFTIPEDYVQRVRNRLVNGAPIEVEAFNRDNSAKLATGRLIAVDNSIDPASGTVSLKAEFNNKDRALFPNQFVNVRMPLN